MAGVCAELANRGARDVPIVYCGGLSGFPEAIEAARLDEGASPAEVITKHVEHWQRNYFRGCHCEYQLNRVRLPIRLLEFVTNALRSWGVHAGRAARQLHGQQRHHTKHSVKRLSNGDNPKGDNPLASDDHRDT